MKMPIRTLLKSISAIELAEWQAYENISCGLPDMKQELYLAQLAMYIAAAFGDSKDGYRLGDFSIPRQKAKDKPMTGKEIFTELKKLKKLGK